MELIWRTNKHCYLPILVVGGSLQFVRYHQGDQLKLNQFNIPEPENTTNIILPENLDLVIAPLVAFDAQGRRLGAGGGYYDRTFAFKHASQAMKPMILGLAYAIQQASNLPADQWDVKLDGVITESADC